jgi:hypothetical protein
MTASTQSGVIDGFAQADVVISLPNDKEVRMTEAEKLGGMLERVLDTPMRFPFDGEVVRKRLGDLTQPEMVAYLDWADEAAPTVPRVSAEERERLRRAVGQVAEPFERTMTERALERVLARLDELELSVSVSA